MKLLSQVVGWSGRSSCVLFTICLFFATAAQAETKKEKAFRAFFEEFQKGAYGGAVQILERLPKEEKRGLEVQYWEGVAYSKLQRFDLAIKPLESAVKLDKDRKFTDAAYLLGQAAYSTKDNEKAREAFEKALEQGYKLPATLYYLGYVENQLGNEKKSVEIFERILKLPTDSNEYLQPATFQIAEAKFEIGSNMPQATKENKIAKHDYFVKSVLPAYEAVLTIDSASSLGQQALTRINGVKTLYGLMDTDETAAGIPKPAKPWSASFSEDVKYDTNITNQASGRLNEVSYTASFLEKTSASGKWEFIATKWLVITPELALDATFHSKRTDPVVYTNDSTDISPAVRTRLDHKLWGKPASGLFEYEFNYNTQDSRKVHEQDYKIRSHNLVFGERAEPFPFGSTTFKFSYKFNDNATDANDYGAPKFSLVQNVGFGRYNLNSTFAWEEQYARDPVNDQITYSWNNSVSGPKVFWNVSLDYSLNFTITDTLHQAPARGTERTISPGITATKELSRVWSANLNLTYTNNDSKDKQNFDYHKMVYGLGIKAAL